MKVSLVGIGRVGSAVAYTLVLKEYVEELVLIGEDFEHTEGEALDLFHAQQIFGGRTKVRAGKIPDLKESDIIVLSASAPSPKTVSSRFELGKNNVEVFKTLVPKLVKQAPDAIYLVISNPVDVLTYFTLKLGKLNPKKVFGTGTLIDSARFRGLLSEETGINPLDLRSYILGEHGDTQFPFFSHAFAGGERMDVNESRMAMFDKTKQSGYEIYHKKGYTNYAIAAATNRIIESIAHDSKHTFPVSLLLEDYYGESDVCLSLPAVVGRNGIERVFQLEFSEQEKEAFKRSADTLRETIAKLSVGGN